MVRMQALLIGELRVLKSMSMLEPGKTFSKLLFSDMKTILKVVSYLMDEAKT